MGEKGFVKGDLSATDIVIEGIVEGNVKAVGRILLSQSGSLIGNAEARRLVVSEGATLSGNLKIGLKSNKEKNG